MEEGKGLSDIQKLLKEEFEMNLTFMDVRFLVSDQELRLKALKKKKLEEAVAMEEKSITGRFLRDVLGR